MIKLKSKNPRVLRTGELAQLYKVSRPTMRKRLRTLVHLIGKRIGQFYMPRQVDLIFQELGHPSTMPYGLLHVKAVSRT